MMTTMIVIEGTPRPSHPSIFQLIRVDKFSLYYTNYLVVVVVQEPVPKCSRLVESVVVVAEPLLRPAMRTEAMHV